MTSHIDPCFLGAVELSRLIRERKLSCREALEIHLARIDRVNPKVNAIVTRTDERAREAADAADRRLDDRAAAEPGPLHGLPVAVKDLEPVAGVRTTYGSRIYERYVPDRNALFVDRLLEAGAILVGKTNTPEFGAGSQTFNDVFGRTRNPYDLSATCGGSSGGAAVAVACGMVSVADGSDLGGSLRNPPSFCNVVGLRPSPGRVPRWPVVDPFDTLSVLGPIARSCEDAALLLSVMAGPDARDPLSLAEPGRDLAPPLDEPSAAAKLAWSPDLGGLPVAREVVDALEKAVRVFDELGFAVEEAHPDFEGAAEAFQILRAHAFASAHAEELRDPSNRNLVKDTVIWNVEKGLALRSEDVARGGRLRARVYENARSFLERFDFLLCPVSQVPPFPVEQEWVREIDGAPMDTYIDWMKSAFFISLASLPALSVPAGFTPGGLPVGLQIVGRYRRERDVLALGALFERATGHGGRRPAVVANG